MQVAASVFKLEKGSFQPGSLIWSCCPCGTFFGGMKDTRMKGCVFFISGFRNMLRLGRVQQYQSFCENKVREYKVPRSHCMKLNVSPGLQWRCHNIGDVVTI